MQLFSKITTTHREMQLNTPERGKPKETQQAQDL